MNNKINKPSISDLRTSSENLLSWTPNSRRMELTNLAELEVRTKERGVRIEELQIRVQNGCKLVEKLRKSIDANNIPPLGSKQSMELATLEEQSNLPAYEDENSDLFLKQPKKIRVAKVEEATNLAKSTSGFSVYSVLAAIAVLLLAYIGLRILG